MHNSGLFVQNWRTPLAISVAIFGVLPAVTALFLLTPLGNLNLVAGLFAAAAICFAALRIRDGDVLHPVRIFGALWCTCLSLCALRLIPLISDWSQRTWSVFLIALFAFPIGFAIAGKLGRPRPANSSESPAQLELLNPRAAVTVALGCFVIGLAALALEYWQIGGIPALSGDPAMRMKMFAVAGDWNDPQFDTIGNKISHMFVLYLRYTVYLCCVVLFQGKKRTGKLTLGVTVLAVLGSLAYMSQGGRGLVVDLVVTGLALFHYLKQRIHLRQIVVATMCLSLMIGYVGSQRLKEGALAPAYEAAKSASGLPSGPLVDVAGYAYFTVTSSFEVFNRLTLDLPTFPKSEGGFLFYFLHRLFPRQNIQAVSLELYSGDIVTPTFVAEFYADYGFVGVMLGCLLLGVGYGWLYQRAMRYDSLYWIVMLAILLVSLLYFPYVNLFSQYNTWIWDLISLWVLLKCVRWIGSRLDAHARRLG